MLRIESILEKLNNGNNPAFKELYGTDASELQNQANRYAALIENFKSRFDHSDAALFSSPGRTEIGGNHTDHNFGRVLAGAVNLDNIAIAAPNGTNVIRIESVGYPVFEVSLDNFEIDKSAFYTSGSLVKGICAKLKEKGIRLVVSTPASMDVYQKVQVLAHQLRLRY